MSTEQPIDRKAIGDKVRRARLKKGMSQPELASFIGCSAYTVSSIERGIKGVALGMVYRVCNKLGVSLR